MRDFTLGIIGGCLTHQAGIPKSELYHQRLAKHLEQTHDVRLRVRIARDFREEHVVRLDNLLKEHRVDAVMVHVRSEFCRKAAVITTVHTEGELRYFLHPFLFRPWKSGWAAAENAGFSGSRVILRRKSAMQSLEQNEGVDMADEVPDTTRVAGLSVRDIFYAAGVLVGTDRWAIRDELRMVRDLKSRCDALGLPLFVLGPSRRPDNYWLDRLCRKLEAKLLRLAGDLSVPCCRLPDVCDESGIRIYRHDGFHLNSRGHAYVAERLKPMIARQAGQQAAFTGAMALSVDS